MKLIVAIATLGRPDMVAKTVAHLMKQSRLPDEVVISATSESDIGPMGELPVPVVRMTGPKGGCIQRNLALDYSVQRADIVTFFDDDFLPANTYISELITAFEANPQWTVITGNVIVDGIKGPGVAFSDGLAALDSHQPDQTPRRVTPCAGAYGCNMSMRTQAVGDKRFDERLVLYGWQEDIDFSARVGRDGNIVRLSWLAGVHLGVKSGRVSGVRFGYSQIANPVYLVAKGTVGPLFAANLMLRNLAANMVKCLKPEPWVDRRGRLKGNMLALWDVVRGQAKPERILSL